MFSGHKFSHFLAQTCKILAVCGTVLKNESVRYVALQETSIPRNSGDASTLLAS